MIPRPSIGKLDLCEVSHTVSQNTRTPKSETPRRSQAERRRQTRQALLDAAFLRMEAGESFDALSLRSVARAAGVVPTAFYRHFDGMDELGLALVEESFHSLRAMLREAREQSEPAGIIRRSVAILVEQAQAHRQHFVFVSRVRSSANPVVRHAIRNEIRLFTSELATDLARFPILRDWPTEDLLMLAGLLVNTMIATIEATLDVAVAGPDTETQIARTAEKQLRLVMLAVPHWRTDLG